MAKPLTPRAAALARAREESAAAQARAKEERAEPAVPLLEWLPPAAQMLAVGAIVLAMTPFTNNLDDIKMSLFLTCGGGLAVLALAAMAAGAAPAPHRVVAIGLASYTAVVLLSTIFGKYHWAGRQFSIFNWASIGFFLGGMCIGAVWNRAFSFFVFAVAMVLAVNLFGFFQYDLWGANQTGTMWLYSYLYGPVRAGEQTPLQALLYTFNADAKLSLMSTILNRDFYAAFCLLYLPSLVTVALLARDWPRRGAAIATALFTLASIFLCKSKGEYIFAVVQLALFVGLFAVAVRRLDVRLGYVGAWVGGAAALMGTLLVLNLPTIMRQLKDVNFSLSSRQIIFSGGWQIFLRFPILGAGPGAFKIYFPLYRRADYWEHEISNVTELSHNYVLDILCETGLLGAITFAIFALGLAWLAFRMAFRAEDRRLRLLIIACLCGLLGMYGSNMTSTSGRWPIGATGLWTILGVMAGLVRQGEGWAPSARRFDWASLWARKGMGPGAIQRAAACVALLGLMACAWESQRYWRASATYNEGLMDFNRVAMLHTAEVMNPNLDAGRRKTLSDILIHSGERFRAALEIYPEHVSAYYKLGSSENFLANLQPERQEERLLASKAAYDKLREYFPDYAEVHFNMGVIYLRLAQIAKDKLAKLAPPAAPAAQTPAGDERDRLMNQVKECEEGRRKHFEIMRRMSEKADVFRQLGSSYFFSGMPEMAEENFREAMKRYPKDESFPRDLLDAAGAAKDLRGQFDALKALYRLIPGSRSDQQFHYKALQLAIQQRYDEEFDALMRDALAINPVDPMLYELQISQAEVVHDPKKGAAAAAKYLKLARAKEILAVPQWTKGAKPEILRKGAAAAEGAGDAALARALYQELAQKASPLQGEAQAWLAAHLQ